jgi:spermidine/putrescine transport system permease protein
MKKKDNYYKYILLAPVIIYALLLILLPILYIVAISFLKHDIYGGIIKEITLTNYINVFNLIYVKVFIKSFIIALIATLICIVISYPFVIFVNEKRGIIKNIIMTFVIVPFLTNSLIRMYGWIILLRKDGIINHFLLNINLIKSPLSLMYNNAGIITGMVYTLLPFMILPLYSSISKIDKRLLEASTDLGATKWKTFTNIIVPLTLPGLFNGSLMVFMPAIGYFFISDILGGGKLMLLGNLIKNQFLTARNWPFGAAISVMLLLITYLLVKVYKHNGGKMEELGGL